MSKPIVLVTSATGGIGRELVALLKKENQILVHACYFSDSQAGELIALRAQEVVKFDLLTPKPVTRRL